LIEKRIEAEQYYGDPLKTLLVDNYDSFTYNLYQLLGAVNGLAPKVITNDSPEWESLNLSEYDNIVISPGPGSPDRPLDFGMSAKMILETKIPLLGVCLGHQGICHLFGGRVGLAPEPMHGRLSPVYHNEEDIFAGIPSPYTVVRYHSLAATDLPDDLEPIAWSPDGVLMAVRHRSRPIRGVQFHPESICTEHGQRLIENFRRLTEEHQARHATVTSTAAPAPQSLKPVVSSKTSAPRYRVHVRKLPILPSAEHTFEQLYLGSQHSFWLDSSKVMPGLSRFSFMGDGSGPLSEFVSYHITTGIVTIERQGKTLRRHQPFFEFMKDELQARAVPNVEDLPFEFNLGYVGYIGYELKGECGVKNVHKSPTPDAMLVFADRMIAFDHQEKTTYLLCLSEKPDDASVGEWMESTTRTLFNIQNNPANVASPLLDFKETSAEGSPLDFRHDRHKYFKLITECQQEIRAGESYEICLTNMLSANASIDPWVTYNYLRRISPAPYSTFLKFPDVSVLSASPERFLTITAGGMVESKPIKGTRARGATPELDKALRLDLESNEKDRAENLMIVDLVRNDLYCVCEIGSVQASLLFAVETYATAHQLVSTIRGKLREGVSTAECIRAAFPGGSMTGAPKIRTMEIIDRLEGGARGIYSGAIGFFALSGASDLSIVIRTIVATPEVLTFGVGGAILAISSPEGEIDETMVKAKAMTAAIMTTATFKTERVEVMSEHVES
jgi:para-aminobenzoate synthetase